jgi:hypothetical protein
MLGCVEPGTPTSGGSDGKFNRTPSLTAIYYDASVDGPHGRARRRGGTPRTNAGRKFPRPLFLMDADFEPGSPIEFILTLPREITLAGDVHIRCFAEIIRVEPHNGRRGIAARIDRYEFLPAAA